ncbi:hypothetical protein [Celerinatantimonas sp. YJH-8]|uniref:hypothetical protein n=1 Tax=Celerinatantimonas sp. YJH-8 TaxID=3228714 RepID=UPI0038C6D1E4
MFHPGYNPHTFTVARQKRSGCRDITRAQPYRDKCRIPGLHVAPSGLHNSRTPTVARQKRSGCRDITDAKPYPG